MSQSGDMSNDHLRGPEICGRVPDTQRRTGTPIRAGAPMSIECPNPHRFPAPHPPQIDPKTRDERKYCYAYPREPIHRSAPTPMADRQSCNAD